MVPISVCQTNTFATTQTQLHSKWNTFDISAIAVRSFPVVKKDLAFVVDQLDDSSCHYPPDCKESWT
jgi:hypothetical protein